MGKIVLLVSREEMLHQAHNILQEKTFQIHQMKVIRTENAVTEARRAIADGASIIIARGLQASLIKQYTSIPVVEIVLTAQEMALLVMKAKQVVQKPRPVIAVVGFENMFCDMSYFDELYDIELRTYFVREGEQLPEAVRTALEEGADLVIGGDTAVALSGQAGRPSLFLSMTEDSMRQAFSVAENMEYAMSVEKKAAAQMETLLDSSFSGVLRLDSDGVVTAANPMMEDITGKAEREIMGMPIRELAPTIGEEALSQVLKEGKDYSLFLDWGHVPVFVVMAPVQVDGRVDGAILTCHRMKKKTAADPKQEKRQGRRRLPALVRFEDVLQRSPAMQDCVRLAGLYALSDQPVVLRGEPGTEKRMLAESIHNGSGRSSGPFLDVPCEGMSGEEQRGMIFGDRGAALQAQGGTLLLRNGEYLTAANQYRLYQLIRFKVCNGEDIASLRKVDVRVIATMGMPLCTLAGQGRIRQDLYYLLSGLELEIPPLRERREDLEQKLEDTLRECCERYSRYHVLTAGARALLLNYPWPGNLFQIESFFERLVLTAGKRSIDEISVGGLLKALYPEQPDLREQRKAQGGGEEIVAEEALAILAALRRFGGSREKTADSLGISKATLWRKMKKYGIQD